MPIKYPIQTIPDEADTTLEGAWLNQYVTGADDFSANAKNGTETDTILGNGEGLFNGTSSIMQSSAIDSSGWTDLTVTAWINLSAVVAFRYIASQWVGAPGLFLLTVNGGQAEFYVHDAGNNTIVAQYTTSAIANGQWYYLVGTFDGDTCRIYVNADEGTSDSAISSGLAGDSQVVNIGSSGASYTTGTIRDVRVYSEVKSAQWVADRFAAGVPDSTLALSVENGQDLSRYERSLTASGGIILGYRMELDGTDDKLDAGDIGNILEISAWVNPATTTEELFLVDAGKDIMINAGTVTYTGLTATATYVDGAATTTMVAGSWQHLVCQFEVTDANNMELGNDGANYGQFDCNAWAARTAARTAQEVADEYNAERDLY